MHLGRKIQVLLMMLNFVVNLLVIFASKGCVANKHLVYNDSQRPPIYQLSITHSSQHLRRNVIWSAHCTIG